MTREPGPPAAWSPGSPAIVWIERAVGPGARVTRVESLPASATAKHRIEAALPGGSMRPLLLRRYHDARRLAHDPWYDPSHDARVLRLLNAAGGPAPRLYAADLEAAVCDVPAILESWVAGAPAWRPADLEGYLARAAEVLVAIHATTVPAEVPLPRYAPYREPARMVPPAFRTRPLWERVAALLDLPWPAHRETFIHRDYHPGNVLWDGARVMGVVDWSTAAWGPPGIDLARMRLNLASGLGVEAADRFAILYAAAGGDPSARDPFWDLLDAADSLPDAAPMRSTPEEAGRFEDYVEGVLAEVGKPKTA